MPEYQRSDKERIASLETDIGNLKETLKTFVTRDEFLPVKLIAYGLAAIVLSSVAVTLIGRVLLK
jgi:hypothetical protein